MRGVDFSQEVKAVLPCELAEYFCNGVSVIYYQHKARRLDSFYIEQHKQLLSSGSFPGAVGRGLKFATTSQRYYFFIIQPKHEEIVSACIREMMETPWNKHFRMIL